MRLSSALRTVALLEAAKGALVLIVGFGLLSLIGRDVERFAERLITHFHLNPASHYPRIFLDLADRVTNTNLMLLAAGACIYSLVRFVEAYGLWNARAWAEWFAALSGGIYIPFEILRLHKHVSWTSIGLLILNVVVVVFMLYCVFRARDHK
jgi:uncharacterized membrane protein (DUF2068 family)